MAPPTENTAVKEEEKDERKGTGDETCNCRGRSPQLWALYIHIHSCSGLSQPPCAHQLGTTGESSASSMENQGPKPIRCKGAQLDQLWSSALPHQFRFRCLVFLPSLGHYKFNNRIGLESASFLFNFKVKSIKGSNLLYPYPSRRTQSQLTVFSLSGDAQRPCAGPPASRWPSRRSSLTRPRRTRSGYGSSARRSATATSRSGA